MEASLTHCDQCNGTLRKVFNPVGVVFKGSGFYATDNRTQGQHNAASLPPEHQTGEHHSSEHKADHKPGHHTESKSTPAPAAATNCKAAS